MSIESMANGNGSSPTSWRDVYTLVQDVEGRLTRSITSAHKDHEIRIRAIEIAGTPVAATAAAVAAANTIRITALERVNRGDDDRRMGAVSVFSYGQKVIVAVVIVANALAATIALIKP